MAAFKSRYLQRSQYVTSIQSKNLEARVGKLGRLSNIPCDPVKTSTARRNMVKTDLCAEFRAVGQGRNKVRGDMIPTAVMRFALAGIVPVSRKTANDILFHQGTSEVAAGIF